MLSEAAEAAVAASSLPRRRRDAATISGSSSVAAPTRCTSGAAVANSPAALVASSTANSPEDSRECPIARSAANPIAIHNAVNIAATDLACVMIDVAPAARATAAGAA
jgi:hypothetical protein